MVRNAVLPGAVGYRVTAAGGGIDRVAGGVDDQGARGRYEVAVERMQGQVAERIGARCADRRGRALSMPRPARRAASPSRTPTA